MAVLSTIAAALTVKALAGAAAKAVGKEVFGGFLSLVGLDDDTQDQIKKGISEVKKDTGEIKTGIGDIKGRLEVMSSAILQVEKNQDRYHAQAMAGLDEVGKAIERLSIQNLVATVLNESDEINALYHRLGNMAEEVLDGLPDERKPDPALVRKLADDIEEKVTAALLKIHTQLIDHTLIDQRAEQIKGAIYLREPNAVLPDKSHGHEYAYHLKPYAFQHILNFIEEFRYVVQVQLKGLHLLVEMQNYRGNQAAAQSEVEDFEERITEQSDRFLHHAVSLADGTMFSTAFSSMDILFNCSPIDITHASARSDIDTIYANGIASASSGLPTLNLNGILMSRLLAVVDSIYGLEPSITLMEFYQTPRKMILHDSSGRPAGTPLVFSGARYRPKLLQGNVSMQTVSDRFVNDRDSYRISFFKDLDIWEEYHIPIDPVPDYGRIPEIANALRFQLQDYTPHLQVRLQMDESGSFNHWK